MVTVISGDVEQSSSRILGLWGGKKTVSHIAVSSETSEYQKKPSGTMAVRADSRKNGLHMASLGTEEACILTDLDTQNRRRGYQKRRSKAWVWLKVSQAVRKSQEFT